MSSPTTWKRRPRSQVSLSTDRRSSSATWTPATFSSGRPAAGIPSRCSRSRRFSSSPGLAPRPRLKVDCPTNLFILLEDTHDGGGGVLPGFEVGQGEDVEMIHQDFPAR